MHCTPGIILHFTSVAYRHTYNIYIYIYIYTQLLYIINTNTLSHSTMHHLARAMQAPVLARFPSSPFIIRVPFFLLFGFNTGTPEPPQKKGKRVLLGNLVRV